MEVIKLHFSAISLLPEMFQAVSEYGVIGRAIKQGRVGLTCVNPRDFTTDKHRTVDDRPYGGGPGMLMKVEPLDKAIEAAKNSVVDSTGQCKTSQVIYLTPQGEQLNTKVIKELSQTPHLILLSGRYEGVDQRLINAKVDREISIGDFVLSGGELASMVVIDAITRYVPEVLGHSASAVEDSFEDGLLDHPHYTRPEVFEGQSVPAVLKSGDHKAIERWRLKQRLGNTWQRRPDLLNSKSLSDEETSLLNEFKAEQAN